MNTYSIGRIFHKISGDENCEFVNKGTADMVARNIGDKEKAQKKMIEISSAYSYLRQCKNRFKLVHECMSNPTDSTHKLSNKMSYLVDKIILMDFFGMRQNKNILVHPYTKEPMNTDLLSILEIGQQLAVSNIELCLTGDINTNKKIEVIVGKKQSRKILKKRIAELKKTLRTCW